MLKYDSRRTSFLIKRQKIIPYIYVLNRLCDPCLLSMAMKKMVLTLKNLDQTLLDGNSLGTNSHMYLSYGQIVSKKKSQEKEIMQYLL